MRFQIFFLINALTYQLNMEYKEENKTEHLLKIETNHTYQTQSKNIKLLKKL